MTTFSSAPPRQAHRTAHAAIEADQSRSAHHQNVGELERWISSAAGAALVFHGLRQRSLASLALAAVVGGLLQRGATGHCQLYHKLGVSTADPRRPSLKRGSVHRGILIKRSITVSRPVDNVFAFWRHLENLPRFMLHLQSVTSSGPNRSHWVVRGPMGSTVEWDAEIINEKPNELIAWRSVEGSEVDHAGTVRFNRAPGDRGTEVHVELNYEPPGGRFRRAIAWLFGEEPRIQMEDDLMRFKQLMETGEIASVDGQPRGH